VTDFDLLREVEQFLYREARLADDAEYDAWEDLWADEAIYWVPSGGDDIDPTREMSIIFDNRSRIGLRVKQLMTGKRHSQTPRSRTRRVIANVELLEPDPDAPDGTVVVGANFVLYESRPRGTRSWAGRYRYRLLRTEAGWRMARKDVFLVDNDRPLPTMAFLI
jgi:3-phenylpropionate/cinnamic acid dioxygenase small subunit